MQKIDDYKLSFIFSNVHLYKNEVKMEYLPLEKNNIKDCEAMCLEDNNCVAANYYYADIKKNKSAQCWIFSAVDYKKISFNQKCCDLIIPGREKKAIAAFKNLSSNNLKGKE